MLADARPPTTAIPPNSATKCESNCRPPARNFRLPAQLPAQLRDLDQAITALDRQMRQLERQMQAMEKEEGNR